MVAGDGVSSSPRNIDETAVVPVELKK